MLCLDEPTAGLAQRETEKFGPLLVSIRKEMSASMIIVEHDMPLIMSMSDRIYCLELGGVIAEGSPPTCATIRSWSPATSEPTSGRSSAATVP